MKLKSNVITFIGNGSHTTLRMIQNTDIIKFYNVYSNRRHGLRSCLTHYPTSQKVAGSIPDEVTEFFQFIYSFQPQYGPRVDIASKRNEYQEHS
jgi:hypothetical protein